MDFSEDWKSLWPVASVYAPPLLLQQRPLPSLKRTRSEDSDDGEVEEIAEIVDGEIGPLIFVPCSESLVQLFSSPELAPRLSPRYPGVSLRRFLHTTTSSILPCTALSIASEFGNQVPESSNWVDDRSHGSYFMHGFNHLQLLPCSSGCSDGVSPVLAFFPTGENCDRVGHVILYSKDGNQRLLVTKDRLKSRILQLLVNPVVELDDSIVGEECMARFCG